MDPLFTEGGVGLAVVLIVLAKTFLVFGLLLIGTMLMVWFERKVHADMTNRLGPNRAGPWGILQTLADGTKLFFKEDLLPERADKRIFRLAPFLSFVPAFLVFSIVPIGGTFGGSDDPKAGVISIFGKDTFAQLADPPIGILVVLAMSSVAVYGVMLAGWSSGSKYPLLGSVRASASMVSYEAALGLSTVTVIIASDAATLSTHEIVTNQSGGFVDWNILTAGVVPFVVFLLAATAEMNRPPFDLVEAEQELVGGFNTEYSGIRFALFFLAEFMSTITMSGVIVTLFLGGPTPLFGPDNGIFPTLWFFGKVVVFLFMFVWFRATLPRLRYDQLMDLGWKILIPVSLGWLLLVSALRISEDEGWNQWAVAGIGGATILGAGSLLGLAVRTGQRRRALGEVEV